MSGYKQVEFCKLLMSISFEFFSAVLKVTYHWICPDLHVPFPIFLPYPEIMLLLHRTIKNNITSADHAIWCADTDVPLILDADMCLPLSQLPGSDGAN
jgi:hypothetical protein